MAKTRGQLLSLGASGKIADSIVTMRRKSRNVAREYVVPSNPRTPQQQATRSLYAESVQAFREYMLPTPPGDQITIDGWNASARNLRLHMSGWNHVIGIIHYHNLTYSDAWMLGRPIVYPDDLVYTYNQCRAGVGWPEPGLYRHFAGPTKDSMVQTVANDLAWYGPGHTLAEFGLTPGDWWLQVWKDGKPATGLYFETLTL